MSGEPSEESVEWDDPEESVEEIDAVIGAFLMVLLGTGLVASSVPGMATLMDGGALGSYGTVGTGVLFLTGIGLVYGAGVFYKEEQLEQEGSSQ